MAKGFTGIGQSVPEQTVPTVSYPKRWRPIHKLCCCTVDSHSIMLASRVSQYVAGVLKEGDAGSCCVGILSSKGGHDENGDVVIRRIFSGGPSSRLYARRARLTFLAAALAAAGSFFRFDLGGSEGNDRRQGARAEHTLTAHREI